MNERRRESRKPATGEVFLFLDSSGPSRVKGTLLDVSDSGFRAVHDHVALSSGTLVRFEHPFKTGEARVIWNRVLGSEVESGFVILREDSGEDPSGK